MPGKDNIELYLRMQEPFGSDEESNESLRLFFEDVEVAREKRHIADVHTIIMVNTKVEGGVLKRGIASQHLGDSQHGMKMCAWSYGKESEAQMAHVDQLIQEGKDWATETNRGNQEGDQEG